MISATFILLVLTLVSGTRAEDGRPVTRLRSQSAKSNPKSSLDRLTKPTEASRARTSVRMANKGDAEPEEQMTKSTGSLPRSSSTRKSARGKNKISEEPPVRMSRSTGSIASSSRGSTTRPAAQRRFEYATRSKMSSSVERLTKPTAVSRTRAKSSIGMSGSRQAPSQRKRTSEQRRLSLKSLREEEEETRSPTKRIRHEPSADGQELPSDAMLHRFMNADTERARRAALARKEAAKKVAIDIIQRTIDRGLDPTDSELGKERRHQLGEGLVDRCFEMYVENIEPDSSHSVSSDGATEAFREILKEEQKIGMIILPHNCRSHWQLAAESTDEPLDNSKVVNLFLRVEDIVNRAGLTEDEEEDVMQETIVAMLGPDSDMVSLAPSSR